MHRFLRLASVVAFLPAVASASLFVDSTNVNTLRQKNEFGVNLVTVTGGYSGLSNGSASGSGMSSGVPVVFNLPQAVKVSSYRITWAGYGAHRADSVLLRGWNGSSWLTLDSQSVTGIIQTSFAATTISKIELTTTGATNTTYAIPTEVQVFADASENIDRRAGYNFLRDARTTSLNSPQVNGIWTNASANSNAVLTDKDYGDAPHDKLLNNSNGFAERGYRGWKLDSPERMYGMTIGFYPGQSAENFEVYTASADLFAATNAMGVYPTASAMQGLGWTLQSSQVSASEPINILFANPGQYQYVIWVANEGVSGAFNEFEVYGVPEPTGLSVLALGLTAGLRRKR